MNQKVIWLCFFVCASCLFVSGGSRAESVFDVLAEKASDVDSTGGLSVVEANKLIVDLQRELDTVRKQREAKALTERLRELQQTEKDSMQALKKTKRSESSLAQHHQESAKEAREGIKVILQIRAATESLEQTLTAALEAHNTYLKTQANLASVLLKQFPPGQPNTKARLEQAIKRVLARQTEWSKERDKSIAQLRQINLNILAQDQKLVKIRQVMLAVPRELPPPRPKPVVQPEVRPEVRPKPRRRSRRRRARRQKRTPAPPVVVQPVAPRETAKEILARRIEEVRSSVQRLQFSRIRRVLRVLSLQKREEELQIQTARLYVWLYGFTRAQLDKKYRLQAAKAEGGVLHFHPFQWKPEVLTATAKRFQVVLTEGPADAHKLLKLSLTQLREAQEKLGWLWFGGALLVPLLLLGLGWYAKRHLRRLIAFCERKTEDAQAGMAAQKAALEAAEAAAAEAVQAAEDAKLESKSPPQAESNARSGVVEEPPAQVELDAVESQTVKEHSYRAAFHTWRTIGLTAIMARDILWLALLCLFLLIVIPSLKLPGAWGELLVMAVFLVMALRGVWTLASHIFAQEPNVRYWHTLDDEHAHKFRRVTKWIACLALLTVPILGISQALGFPGAFNDLLVLALLGLFVGVLCVAFLNQQSILAILNHQQSTGGMSGFVLHRLYPALLLLFVVFWGLYAWGYRNLAAYLLQAVLASVLWIVLGVALFNGLSALNVRLFGRGDSEEPGLIPLEPRLRNQALRSARFLLGGLLILLVSGLMLMSWRVPGGFGAIFKLLNYPFLTIQKSHISLLSIIKFTLVFSAAIWFSRFLKKLLQTHIYPLFRMLPGSQHAFNTVIGYVILAIGGLVGLQVMGMSVGVLAMFAGIVGIGIGFGSQNIANNFISGLLITFGRPISVGDMIEIDKFSGTVKEISARCTTIQTPDARIILIPNSEIISKKVINWSLGPPYVKETMVLSVAYGTDVKVVEKLLLAEANAHKDVLADPKAIVRFKDFGPNSMDISLTIAVTEPSTRKKVISDLRFTLVQKLKELGIQVAAPRQQLLLEPPVEAAVVAMGLPKDKPVSAESSH